MVSAAPAAAPDSDSAAATAAPDSDFTLRSLIIFSSPL